MILLLNEELYTNRARKRPRCGRAAATRRLTYLASRELNVPALIEIAARLADGARLLKDLVWLRSLHPALSRSLCGPDGVMIAPLVGFAIRGTSRPIVIFRAVLPPHADDSWLRALSP